MSPVGEPMRPQPLSPTKLTTVFLVGPNEAGRWLVQETSGLIEGLFVSQRAALKFAMDECRAHPEAVVISASHLKSTFDSAKHP